MGIIFNLVATVIDNDNWIVEWVGFWLFSWCRVSSNILSNKCHVGLWHIFKGL